MTRPESPGDYSEGTAAAEPTAAADASRRQPLVSVIVPTYNSAPKLRVLLQSLMEQSYDRFEVIVNDDLRTSDETTDVIAEFKRRGLEIRLVHDNVLMAQARKAGAACARGEILLHIDSDMKLAPAVLHECASAVQAGADALVIPEESYGTTFWARCRWLERQCYVGAEEIEALRCITRSAYEQLGGHDERMVFAEDKDFDLRVRAAGLDVRRAESFIYHNEGDLLLLPWLVKRFRYTQWAKPFAEQQPEHFRWLGVRSIPRRFRLFYRQRRLLARHPILFAGVLFMRGSEALITYSGLMFYRLRQR